MKKDWTMRVLVVLTFAGLGYNIVDAVMDSNGDALFGWGIATLLCGGLVAALRENDAHRDRYRLLNERYESLKKYKESILDEWKEDQR